MDCGFLCSASKLSGYQVASVPQTRRCWIGLGWVQIPLGWGQILVAVLLMVMLAYQSMFNL